MKPARAAQAPSLRLPAIVGILGIFVIAAAFVYAPALRGTWLWDDAAEVARNPLLRTAAGLAV